MDGEGVSGESSSANQIENWIEEQDRLKRKLIVSDDFSWKLSSSVEFPQGSEMLKYVGGVDMSFSKEDPSVACACLVVLELPSLRVVHYDFSLLRLHVPYVAGFLAFREVTDGGFFFFFCRPDDTITMVIHYGGFMKKIEGEYMYVDECGCKTVQCKQSEVTWSHFKDFTVSEKINRSLNLIWFKKSSDEMYELDYTCDESDNPSNGCMFGVSWSELDVYLEHGNSLHEDIEDREGNDGDDERDNVGDQKEHSDCDEEDVDRPKEDKKPTTATTPIQRTTGQLFSPFTNRPFGFFMLQAPILVQLLQKMRDDQNPFYPQVLMVDGNGILHPRGFGLACHLGVLADLPTIGVGKNLYHVDGLNQSEVRRSLQVKGNEHEQVITLVGNSGITWGVGFRPTLSSLKPIYISVGHRISLDSAITIVKMTCKYRVPEPIRQADMRSREYIQKPKLSLSKELEQRRNVMDEQTEH